MASTPEEEYSDPNQFYTKQEAERYDNNTGMKKSQFLLTKIALEISRTTVSKDMKILDVGCGTGFSLEYFYINNVSKKNLLGIDVSKEMLLLAKKKGFDVRKLGFYDLQKIKQKDFDLILSISSLQWILTNKQEIQIKNDLKKVAKKIYNLLKKEGVFVCQYYPPFPKTQELVVSCFERQRFFVQEYIYNNQSPKKRKVFVVCKKKNL